MTRLMYTTLLLIFTVSVPVLTVDAELHQNKLTVDATDRENWAYENSRHALTCRKETKMSYKAEFLSQAEVCAIYQCLDGHIHVKYRTLDIAMDHCDFHQVAEVFVEALRVLQQVEEPVNEEIDLQNMDTRAKV